MSVRRPRLLPIDPVRPDPAALHEAAAVLRSGGLVAFPTETVYGLGADALNPAAVHGIFEAKGRPPTNPVIVHVAGPDMRDRVVGAWPSAAQALAARFWPGALTLVLPRASAVPDNVTAGSPNVGIRMPAHPVALELIRTAGVPVAAPSANRSSELSPTTAEHVLHGLGDRIDLILDGGPTPNGIESTVLDLTTDPPVVLRPGPISIADLEAVIGPVRRATGVSTTGPLPSPGLLPRHYAPRTPIELFEEPAALAERVRALRHAGIAFGQVLLHSEAGPEWTVTMPADAAGYASRMYAVLHDLDSRALNCILIEMPPETDAWLAVRDRLVRGATPA